MAARYAPAPPGRNDHGCYAYGFTTPHNHGSGQRTTFGMSASRHRANALRSTVRVGGAPPGGGIDWATAQIGAYARSCFLMEVRAGNCRHGSMISGSADAARQARRTTATTSQARGPGGPESWWLAATTSP
jgi:hypothetical protein